MSSGEQFLREYRKALSALHKAQRNKRGRKRSSPELGRLGYVRRPPLPATTHDNDPDQNAPEPITYKLGEPLC